MKILICCLLLFSQVVFMKEFRCDYFYFKEADGWLKLHEMPVSWEEAKLMCYYEGASLVSPTTQQIMDIMVSLVSDSNVSYSRGVFTGIHSTYSKGVFASIEGVTLSKIPHTWAKGEPSAFNDSEDCLILNKDAQFEDVECKKRLPFICYKKYKEMSMSECGTVDKRYILDKRTGSCYKFHSTFHTWSRANLICSAEGGHLAVINNEIEAKVIKDIFEENPQDPDGIVPKEAVAIGFRDWDEHNEWVTVHGQTLLEAGYNKFGKDEPNNFGRGQYCGGVYYGELDDIFCDQKYAFICEKDPNSLHC